MFCFTTEQFNLCLPLSLTISTLRNLCMQWCLQQLRSVNTVLKYKVRFYLNDVV